MSKYIESMIIQNYFPIVIYVNFSQALYSDEETNGTIMITIEADGFSLWPFSVVVTPFEIGGPSTLTLHEMYSVTKITSTGLGRCSHIQ